MVLANPRNPLNIGAAARAMANFGFSRLAVVAPYEPHWREAQSAVGAEELLKNARSTQSLAEAVADCTLVAGTGTLTYRKPEQRVVTLPELAPLVRAELVRGGRVAVVFGPEKHGLTREDLAHCHVLVEIPTDAGQPSMNLGQAVAVCLYELAVRGLPVEDSAGLMARLKTRHRPGGGSSMEGLEPEANAGSIEAAAASGPEGLATTTSAATSSQLERLAGVIEETMTAAGYSPAAMQAANRHDLRLLLRRLGPGERDVRRMLGLFRQILWRLKPGQGD